MIYLKYAKHVLLHKWFVFLACCTLGVPWLGVLHDLSKLLPDEFFPYASYFHGRPPGGSPERDAIRRRMQGDFDRAWLRHLHRNRHHPQHWRLVNDTDGVVLLAMPEKYVREMVADWIGAGMAIYGYSWKEAPQKTHAWWSANQNGSGYALHPDTFGKVLQLLRSLG